MEDTKKVTAWVIGGVAVFAVLSLVVVLIATPSQRCGDYDYENGQYEYDPNDGDYDLVNGEYKYVGCSDSGGSGGGGGFFAFFGSSGSGKSSDSPKTSSGSSNRGGGPGWGK